MIRVTNKEELIGKTISKTAYSENKFFLFFTDNSFCIFRGCGFGDWDVELSQEPFDIAPNDYNLYDLKEAGFISEETYLELVEEKRTRNLKKQYEEDLKRLADLKQKYPNA